MLATNENERRLATIRKISELRPITGADNIELAIIDGWQCVVRKGEFKTNDRCVYFEIDSFVPTSDKRFKFLKKNEICWNGKVGARIKTIKLRKQISQGLALPLADFPEIILPIVDNDVTELLGVEKWELVPPTTGRGTYALQAGLFPSFIPKTDQERLQNMFNDVDRTHVFEVTQKLDGCSATYYYHKGHFGYCSRNFELKPPSNVFNQYYVCFAHFINQLFHRLVIKIRRNPLDNVYWKIVEKYNLEEKLAQLGTSIAIQGEIVGPNINKNRMQLPELDFFVFDIYEIKSQRYFTGLAREELCRRIGLKHVPVIASDVHFNFKTIDEALTSVSRNSMIEGYVWKSQTDPHHHFKIINNEYLIKYGE